MSILLPAYNMPSKISQYRPLAAAEGILIKRKNAGTLFIERLEQQAHQRLSVFCESKEEEAKTLRMYAYQEGYEQGMIDALQQVAAYLTDNRDNGLKWMENTAFMPASYFQLRSTIPKRF